MGNNITIPYSGYIPGGISVGTDVVISGRPHPDFNRFSINLCSGPTTDSDTALHFNPRFNDGKVVRNHKQSGSWGLEDTNGGMPFRRGHNFEFHMKVEHQCYKITINNRHFCNFHHRIPKESVQYLYIEGDVAITFIQFRGQGGYPTGSIPPAYPVGSVPPPYPGGCIPPQYSAGAVPLPAYPGVPSGGQIYNPPVPLTTPIQGGMHAGKIIYITGLPKQNPSRFNINLTCGPHESANIALHFDVRFNFGSGSRNVVVRSHKQGGSFGPEERTQSYFPFTPGVNFEIMILAEHASYKIAVNNQHFTEFFHRIHPLNAVTYLNVQGDVVLTQVRFQ